MKIYLFLQDKILTFSLPKDISGSFSFDPNSEEESKVINIEAKDNNWILYSTNDSFIINNNNIIKEIVLKPDNFYYLKRNNNIYLIYIEDTSLNNILPYQYSEKMNLVIGNTDNCNIRYNFKTNTPIEVRLFNQNNQLILEKLKSSVYINDRAVLGNQTVIKVGDQINIFGFKMLIINNLILFICIPEKFNITSNKTAIIEYNFPNEEPPKNFELKDIDLYNSNEYFSKAPRLRRLVEEKKIKLDNPPNDNNNNELPLILVLGPMLTMGGYSAVTLISTVSRIGSGETTIKEQWPSLLMCAMMLASMLVWPLVTQMYNKHMKKKHKKELIAKYNEYLNEKRNELEKEVKLQREILIENLITTPECINIINQKNASFWNKRVDQSDFLVTRIGFGSEKLAATIEYPEKGFTIEESELEKSADKLVADFKYINNVPVSYSFHENKITAIMGRPNRSTSFINNVLIQLLTFYTYEDIKIVIITNENNKENWEYIKYLNHNFNNEKHFRFFASDAESTKAVLDYLTMEVNVRKNQKRNEETPPKPYYFVIIDDYSKVKRHDFIKVLTESEGNDGNESDLGFSLIIKENMLKNLPSKCNNFIILGENKSGLLKNSYEDQEQTEFTAEYLPNNIDLLNISKILSNIPIEFEEGISNIPDSISFLEMERIGKVEQLNILNRWHMNDSTASLKAEVGVDNQENIIYLDLHEKYHGPHGLIAGTTGSGKSEFIITYVLSMCVNYSPDDISFILIDYKGGGLALAFENKSSGIILPHLAGTITNLDKAEMDRTLVSIKSEAERRQKLFNEAKDQLGESTMDIYKYQKHYHEGHVEEPISHLFIICDEFAELKAQQPEFMDDLISIARIGRSLGVHLILATQKPSGVVNDQIWSNTRFRVCLKVQDEADSKEMLKKPDAAHISQAGRFYLQVGYDEVYTLGQSGWCGAKYFPSDKIVKQVDKSINFINDFGAPIKSIQAATTQKIKAQGEQLVNILKSIIEISDKTGIKAKKLWLENIPEIIIEEELEQKYNITHNQYDVEAIIGEYDAPEKQEQGVVKYNLLNDGNTIIYGNDGNEREMLLNAIIYSTCKNHTSEEINYYIIDYGSETLRKYKKLPQIGDIVLQEEAEKYNNLLKLIREEIQKRKKLFANYGGDYKNFIKKAQTKLPIMTIIMNNYDSIYESDNSLYDELPDLVRDSETYGIIFILTANAINSVVNKIATNFNNIYAFKLKDSADYMTLFNLRNKLTPRDTLGRGMLKTDTIHEFQTISLTKEKDEEEFVSKFVEECIKQNNNKTARKVPVLPNIIRYENVKEEGISLSNLPIGISKKDLEIINIDLLTNLGYIISSNKISYTNIFVRSLIDLLRTTTQNLIIIDAYKQYNLDKSIYPNYYIDSFDTILSKTEEYIKGLMNQKSNIEGVILIYGIDKLISKLEDKQKLSTLIDTTKKYEKFSVIIVDDELKLKAYAYENWFTQLFKTSDGLWIGKGISEQSLLKVSNYNRNMNQEIKNNLGYLVQESRATLIKLIDFYSKEDDNNE